MTSSSDKGGKKGPDEPASDARASEGLDDLMTNPAAVMAAATAFGFGVAAQMSKLFLGSIQGAMEVTGQIARQLLPDRRDPCIPGRFPPPRHRRSAPSGPADRHSAD